MSIKDRTFERIESLFDVQLFADVKVLVAGCGSGRRKCGSSSW